MIAMVSKRSSGVLAALAFSGSVLAVSSSSAHHGPPAPLKTAKNPQLGVFLVDAKGMTLYVYARDKEPGKSTCYGRCAENWPPFAPKAGDPSPIAPLSIITRDDGSKQYAYKGRPLYYFIRDAQPGDTKGHGLGNAWWVVQP